LHAPSKVGELHAGRADNLNFHEHGLYHRSAGFYADVSHLQPDTRCAVEVALPDNLEPGQFQGLFFENVETEFTTGMAR